MSDESSGSFEIVSETPFQDEKVYSSRLSQELSTHPWRRFFARLVDVTTFSVFVYHPVVFCIFYFFPEVTAGLAIIVDNPTFAPLMLLVEPILVYLLWSPFEATLLAFTGTTPAKWLFGIRVLHSSGVRLSLDSAFQRTLGVFCLGEGLGIPLVALFTRIFAYRRLTKTGTTLWDSAVESIVTHRQWGFFRAFFCIGAVVGALLAVAVLRVILEELSME